jgi:hypothetical protein
MAGLQSTPVEDQEYDPAQQGMPGSTPENSEQMQKAEEGEASGGKSPLIFDPAAPARDTVADRRKMQVEGQTEDKPISQQIHSSQIPVERDPDKAWQDYGVMAINGLYPHMRNGVDFAWGRREFDGDAELLAWDEKFAPPDMAKIEEAARKLAGQNPYTDYKPRPSLAPGQSSGADQGEVHWDQQNRELDPSVAQSEYNPANEEKVPSQAYDPEYYAEQAPA